MNFPPKSYTYKCTSRHTLGSEAEARITINLVEKALSSVAFLLNSTKALSPIRKNFSRWYLATEAGVLLKPMWLVVVMGGVGMMRCRSWNRRGCERGCSRWWLPSNTCTYVSPTTQRPLSSIWSREKGIVSFRTFHRLLHAQLIDHDHAYTSLHATSGIGTRAGYAFSARLAIYLMAFHAVSA